MTTWLSLQQTAFKLDNRENEVDWMDQIINDNEQIFTMLIRDYTDRSYAKR